jgi:hypothetical protein
VIKKLTQRQLIKAQCRYWELQDHFEMLAYIPKGKRDHLANLKHQINENRRRYMNAMQEACNRIGGQIR